MQSTAAHILLTKCVGRGMFKENVDDGLIGGTKESAVVFVAFCKKHNEIISNAKPTIATIYDYMFFVVAVFEIVAATTC